MYDVRSFTGMCSAVMELQPQRLRLLLDPLFPHGRAVTVLCSLEIPNGSLEYLYAIYESLLGWIVSIVVTLDSSIA